MYTILYLLCMIKIKLINSISSYVVYYVMLQPLDVLNLLQFDEYVLLQI